MIVTVGSGAAVARARPGLEKLLAEPIVTLERIRLCKRDGNTLVEPRHVAEQDGAGLGIWQKLTIYSSKQARSGGHPLHVDVIRRLRMEGASGATSLRGVWGVSGDHPPHGDRLFRVRREVPVVTSIVDRPARIRRWFEIVDECTASAGLGTSELVPALRAVSPGRASGDLRLARLRR